MAAKKKPIARGPRGTSPTEDYYAQIDQHPLRVRVSKATLTMLDDLVELTAQKTKVQAVEEAIALAHRTRVSKRR